MLILTLLATALQPPVSVPDAGLAVPARPHRPLASYITGDDYPPDALRRGDEGIVGFELTVGADGVVMSCHIIASSGSSSLDDATCRLLRRRASFEPARNVAGNPIAGTVRSQISWSP